MSVIINILAFIGMVVIISYLIYYLYVYIKNRAAKQIAASIYPPGEYMQNTGVKCPDYWVNTGIDAGTGNYICNNSFNVPLQQNANASCKSDTIMFSPVTSGSTWEYGNPNNLTSYSDIDKYNFLTTPGTAPLSRCDWVNKCGSAANIQGTWSGINEICNQPAPTSN